MLKNNAQQSEIILHPSKEGMDLDKFHEGLEDFLKFAITQGVEEQLDGLHVAREAKHAAQHQEGNEHEQ